MKKSGIITALAAAAIFGGSLTSCDEVKENDRYIDMGEITAKRTVLLEEFTGQFCNNCPKAHKVIENIVELYGENIVAVSIHAGRQSIGENENSQILGLRVDEGNEYASHWGILEYPNGIINRSSGAKGHAEWQTIIRQEMEKTTIVEIVLNAVYDPTKNKVIINTTLSPGANFDGRFQVWVTESGIVAPQTGNMAEVGFSYKADYVHNHVFRDAVNGTWGEEITLITRKPETLIHEFEVKEDWNISNMSIVVFLYNDEEGVIQASECHITPKTDTEQ